MEEEEEYDRCTECDRLLDYYGEPENIGCHYCPDVCSLCGGGDCDQSC